MTKRRFNTLAKRLAACTCLYALPIGVQAQTLGVFDQVNTVLAPYNINLSGHVECGITVAATQSNNKTIAGNVYNQYADQPVCNQVFVKAEMPINSTEQRWQFGSNLSLLYGTDSRLIQTSPLNSIAQDSRYQITIPEANIVVHAPLLVEGGIDTLFGIFLNPMGSELLDPTQTPDYSHSQLFANFLPTTNLGIMSTAHVSSSLDVVASLDTGANSTWGHYANNSHLPKATFGIVKTYSKWLVADYVRIGNESTQGTRSGQRVMEEVTVKWLATDLLSIDADALFVRDNGLKDTAWDLLFHAAYKLDNWVTLQPRLELTRDQTGSFATVYPNANDSWRAALGKPNGSYSLPGGTIGTITLGADITANNWFKQHGIHFWPEFNVIVGPIKPVFSLGLGVTAGL